MPSYASMLWSILKRSKYHLLILFLSSRWNLWSLQSQLPSASSTCPDLNQPAQRALASRVCVSAFLYPSSTCMPVVPSENQVGAWLLCPARSFLISTSTCMVVVSSEKHQRQAAGYFANNMNIQISRKRMLTDIIFTHYSMKAQLMKWIIKQIAHGEDWTCASKCMFWLHELFIHVRTEPQLLFLGWILLTILLLLTWCRRWHHIILECLESYDFTPFHMTQMVWSYTLGQLGIIWFVAGANLTEDCGCLRAYIQRHHAHCDIGMYNWYMYLCWPQIE